MKGHCLKHHELTTQAVAVVPLLRWVRLFGSHGLHARLPCPSPSPRVCSDSCPLSQFISFSATLFSFCLQFFPVIRVFPNELTLCITWPKYWSFSFSISPSNEYSKLISLRIDWFDLLAVQGTLKNLL